MKQRYYSDMSDENLKPPAVDGDGPPSPAAKEKPPPLPPRTPLSPPDEAEEHPDLEKPQHVKRDSYFPYQPTPEKHQDAGEEPQELDSKSVDGDYHTPGHQTPQDPATQTQNITKENPQTENATKEAPKGLNGEHVTTTHPPPPQRQSRHSALTAQTQPSIRPNSWHRSLTTLTAFLIPYPKPQLPPVGAHTTSQLIPPRFMIYTPPTPPFLTKPEGETRVEAWRKEGIATFCRRKWYEELREAKMREPKDGKTTKSKRAKWKATKGTDWGIDKTKSTNLEFLNRVARLQDEADEGAEDVYSKHVSPEGLVLMHPPDLKLTIDGSHDHDEELLRENFTASLLRTKKRAIRDTAISALLFPPAIVIDTVAVPIWPFGGLAEIDAVWFYTSFRGARTSHTITKRLSTTSEPKKLDLTLSPFSKMDVLERYLAARCHDADSKLFPEYVATPADTEVLKAIGWTHWAEGWEDRQWELQQVKDDLERCFGKAAREWVRFCRRWVKDPEKAVKK